MLQPDSHTSGEDAEVEPFSFMTELGDNRFGYLDDAMEMVTNALLAQAFSMEVASNLPSWEQWDAWLAESNLLPPESFTQDIGAGT